eukprot:2088709-Pyramimonas_sp.AAC.2
MDEAVASLPRPRPLPLPLPLPLPRATPSGSSPGIISLVSVRTAPGLSGPCCRSGIGANPGKATLISFVLLISRL